MIEYVLESTQNQAVVVSLKPPSKHVFRDEEKPHKNQIG
jgi:hypothetical protein